MQPKNTINLFPRGKPHPRRIAERVAGRIPRRVAERVAGRIPRRIPERIPDRLRKRLGA